MNSEDILISFKPHTTSKILDELIGIETLGFRGEALSSIAAVSNLMIQSRTSTESAGTQVILENGTVSHVGPIGMPPGTTITVLNLFHTVPARKKFLKSERTEFRHIVELITSYAISYPEIRFSLQHNKRIIFDLPKNQTIYERVEKLLGISTYHQLFPIITDPSYITIKGFIAHPQVSTISLNKQYLFVNHRSIADRGITNVVREAYGSLLEAVRYPIFILFLDLPHDAVDVNVHPRKEQIKFMNTSFVLDTVKQTVTKTLAENNLTFTQNFHIYSPKSGTTDSYAAEVLREQVTPWNVKDIAKILKTSDIQQLHDVYLLVQTKNGLLLIDQHAAHERILFEQFLREFKLKHTSSTSYRLETPVIIDLPFSETENLIEHLQSLKAVGFDIESFAQNSYRINAVPELFKDRDMRLLILELLEHASEGKNGTVDHINQTMISYLACRAAIKAGEKVTKEEAKRLIEKLEETNNNATCPHGRPTKIEISLIELNKYFKR